MRGREAVHLLVEQCPALVLLDFELPDMDGVDVCRRMRCGGYLGGIIAMSSRAGEIDRVVGLDAGADDYLIKPFGLAELTARVRALLRRTGITAAQDSTVLTTSSGLRVDTASRRVIRGHREIALTAREFDVLAMLAAHPGHAVAREALVSGVWDRNWRGSARALDSVVGRLRAKLAAAEAGVRVVAVRGVGFRLESVT